jgi:hypothetical protein
MLLNARKLDRADEVLDGMAELAPDAVVALPLFARLAFRKLTLVGR